MTVVSYNESKSGNNSLIVHGNEGELKRVAEFVKHMHDEPTACASDSEDIEEDMTVHDAINRPTHYCSGKIETIEKIEIVLSGIYGESAYDLGNILKYFDRAGLKDDTKQDLDKANNYAHRLIYGKWRNE